MANLTNPPWLQWRPLTPVTKLRTYVQLPAFDVAVTWLGYSELVYQYNFSASQAFYLKNRPSKPVGVNYLLCIKYRIGETVYRYKLWNGVGEVTLDEVPLYTNQLILPNFVLEIWSTEGQTDAVQATAINLITSVVEMPTTISDLDDVALAVGAGFDTYAAEAPVVTTPTSTFYWNPGALLTNEWNGSNGGLEPTPTLPWGTTPRTLGTNQGYAFVVDPQVTLQTIVSSPGLNNRFSFWIAFFPTTWVAGDTILLLKDNTQDYSFAIMTGTTTNSYIIRRRYLGAVVDSAEITDLNLVGSNIVLVANLHTQSDGTAALAINSSAEVSIAGLGVGLGGFDQLTVVQAGNAGVYNVQEMRMLRNSSQGVNPNTSLAAYWLYFFDKYNMNNSLDAFSTTLTFDADTAWLDNDSVVLPE